MSAFRELVSSIIRKPDAVLPSIQAFPAIDVEQVVGELAIEKRAAERGSDGLPPTSATSPDAVELEIVGDIERRTRKGAEEYFQNLDVYESRIRRGYISGEQRVRIIAEGANTISELKASIRHDLDELRLPRAAVSTSEKEYAGFVTEHRVRRTPVIVTPKKRMYLAIVVGLLLVLETATNGVFFARGSETGLIGGFAQAFVLSVLNVGGGLLYGWVFSRWLSHHRSAMKLAGVLVLLLYVLYAVGLNLSIAHFRDLFIANQGVVASSEVFARVTANPLGLADTQSVLLAGLGLVFALLAVIDGRLFDDPYPGFGAVARRRHDAHDAYTAAKARCVVALTKQKNDAIGAMRDVLDYMRKADHDRQLAADGRQRLHRNYLAYLDHLQGALEQLIARYRDANRAARGDNPPPPYFSDGARHLLTFERPELRPMPELLADERREVAEKMEFYIHRLNEEYDEALKRYESTDSLAGEEPARAAA
jgi:hypothetical protein